MYCVLPPYAPAAATPLSTPPTLLCVLFMKAMKKTKQLAEGGPRGLHSCLSDESLCRFCFRPVLYGQKKKVSFLFLPTPSAVLFGRRAAGYLQFH